MLIVALLLAANVSAQETRNTKGSSDYDKLYELDEVV
jgi:hypothetical protein